MKCSTCMTQTAQFSRVLCRPRSAQFASLAPQRRAPASLRLQSTAATSPASSVRGSEIEHFSRLSSEWWNEKGEFGLLHTMNPSRVQFIRKKITEVAQYEDAVRARLEGRDGSDAPLPTRFLDGKDVIDVGCGGGLLTEVRT